MLLVRRAADCGFRMRNCCTNDAARQHHTSSFQLLSPSYTKVAVRRCLQITSSVFDSMAMLQRLTSSPPATTRTLQRRTECPSRETGIMHRSQLQRNKQVMSAITMTVNLESLTCRPDLQAIDGRPREGSAADRADRASQAAIR